MEVSSKTIQKIITSFKNFITIEDYYTKHRTRFSFCISFDDGHASVYDYFKNIDLPFTLNITVGSIGTPSYLSWEQIRQMHKSKKADIQNHGMDHFKYFRDPNIKGVFLSGIPNILDFEGFKSKIGLPYSETTGDYFLKRFIFSKSFLSEFQKRALEQYNKHRRVNKNDIKRILSKIKINRGKFESKDERNNRINKNILYSRDVIQRKIGKTVFHFAWPYGDYSKEGIKFIKASGYISCSSIELGSNNFRTSSYHHRRITLQEWKMPVMMIKLKSSNFLKYSKRFIQRRRMIEC